MSKKIFKSPVEKEKWDIVIKPSSNAAGINFKELFNYTDLVFLFVSRDFVAQYKQTILGPFWYLIQPLLTTIVFTVIFGNVAKISTDGLPRPLFYLAGLTVWNFFSQTLTAVSQTFIKNAHLFGKVYFPRMTVPLSTLFSKYIALGFQFVLFLAFYAYYAFKFPEIRPNIYLLLIPVIIIQASILAVAFGMIVSAVTVKYRDLQQLVAFGVHLWMYATPIVYPMSKIPEKWKWLFMLNPMAHSVELFKYAFTGVGEVNLPHFGVGFLITLLFAVWGIISYNKADKTFVDQV